jgi:hypothetical protein
MSSACSVPNEKMVPRCKTQGPRYHATLHESGQDMYLRASQASRVFFFECHVTDEGIGQLHSFAVTTIIIMMGICRL